MEVCRSKKPKNVLIGNENFKEWLKALDPVYRVKHIGDISRALYVMGLRGSEIKAALAQLSQRCQVMLVKLSEKEIKRYTRKPLKKLPQWNAELFPHHGDKQLDFIKRKPDEHNNFQKKQKKKYLRMKELFGEEEDESGNIVIEEIGTNEYGERRVNNYMSTTVNVNIYNTTSNNSLGNSSDLKRKSYTEKSVMTSNEVAPKKLRIDVSLSNKNKSEIKSKNMVSVLETNEGSPLQGTKTTSSKLSSKQKGSSKNKHKKDRQKKSKHSSSTKKNATNEEDPSIKELWAIFGMESPTDRTAKYFSSQFATTETITLHSASEKTNPGEEPVAQSPTNINGQPSFCTLQGPVHKTLEPSNQLGTEVEPFLKISETFSLANTDREDSITSSECADVESEKNLENGNERREGTCSVLGNVIEPVRLDRNNGKENKTIGDFESTPKQASQKIGQIVESEKPKSKVGTIRVKNIGELVNPELVPNTNENGLSANQVSQSNVDVTTSNQPELNNEDTEEQVENRFFSTYSYYFNEIVENKIPKLGELLHLAIADVLRFTERVKRADQLSSEDLIKEEKVRAQRDFSDMMRVRGVEFAPLCDLIVKGFDVGSKITLFIALICRILKHAGSIDPANLNCSLQGKKVIWLMLKRHQSVDKDILEMLNSDDDEFVEKLQKVQDLIDKCTRRKSKTTELNRMQQQSLSSKRRNSNTCNVLAPTTGQVSQGRQTTSSCNTMKIHENSFQRKHESLSKGGRENDLIQGQSKTTTPTTGKENGSLPNTIANGSCTNNVTSNGTQQPFMLQNCQVEPTPSNLTTSRNDNSQTRTPQDHTITQTHALISSIQAALRRQMVYQTSTGMNQINTLSNSFSRNNANFETQANIAVVQNINIISGQFQNVVPNTQTGLLAKSKETLNRRNSRDQEVSHTFITPQASQGTASISTRAEKSSTSVTSSTISHAPPTHAAVPQAPTGSSYRPSTTNALNYRAVMISTSAAGTVNKSNSSAPQQHVGTFIQPPVSSSQVSHPSQSSLYSRSGVVSEGYQQRLNGLETPSPQTRLNSDSLVNVGDVIDRTVSTVMAAESSQLQQPEIHKSNATNKRPCTSPLAISSPRTASSPEITSPTAEVNLPSSSHCHPFIARRPISGKMKMLFESTNN